MTRPHIILIHGNGNAGPDLHWFPYVKRALERSGLEVTAKQFPDAELAREVYWIPLLREELKANENSILIGHSSGAVCAMRFAEKYKIYGSILVGSYYTDLGYDREKSSGYFNRAWNWNRIRANQRWIVQFSSTDDLLIPIEEPRFIHEKLQSEYYEFHDRGHFGVDQTVLEFPELVDVVIGKIKVSVL